jgi:hypothetical protein
MKKLLYLGLFVLYLLHNDLWLWNDGRMIAGIPVGLLYHIAFCVAASVMMFLLVRYSWPNYLEVEFKDEDRQ